MADTPESNATDQEAKPNKETLGDFFKDVTGKPPEEFNSIELLRAKSSRTTVAARIADYLLYLFIGQVSLLIVAYILLVFIEVFFTYINPNSPLPTSSATSAILEAVKVILPATTTFLGVAIGYYFRDSRDRENND